MICDPHRVCFVILKPVIKTQPVPKDVVSRFWKPDDNSILAARSGEVSAPNTGSDLTELSKTPTPPQGSTIVDISRDEDSESPEADVKGADGSVAVDRDQRVDEWNADVRQSVEEQGYESDIEDNISNSLASDDLEPATFTDDSSMREPAYQNSRIIPDASNEESSEAYGNVDMPTADALEEQQGLLHDDNGLQLDGAGTPFGVHRPRSSSADGSSAASAHIREPRQSHPDSMSVGSAVSNYGAATPGVE